MKGSAQSVYSIATSKFIDTFFLLNTTVWLFKVLLFFSYTKYIFDPISQLFIFMEKLLIPYSGVLKKALQVFAQWGEI